MTNLLRYILTSTMFILTGCDDYSCPKKVYTFKFHQSVRITSADSFYSGQRGVITAMREYYTSSHGCDIPGYLVNLEVSDTEVYVPQDQLEAIK